MNPIASQQAALDNSLVAPEKRLKSKRCNAKIAFTKPQKEETYQVTLDALNFGTPSRRLEKTDGYNFKLDKKKCRVDIEEVGYSGKCDMLSTIRTDQMYQPWRTFAAVINRCISGKSTGLDRLKESHFMYQAHNKEISSARKKHMPYPRFTKVIIDHFISKDNTISMRNGINLHIVRNNTLLGTLKFVSKIEDCQIYGAVIPDGMINEDIKLSKAYKTYRDHATGKVPPKKARKFKKPVSPKLNTILASPKKPNQKDKRVKRAAKKATTAPTTGVVIRYTPDKLVSKTKATAKPDRGKGIELLSDAALLEDEVPDEQIGKTKDTSKGTSVKQGVPDVSKEDSSDSDDDSWGDNKDERYDVHDEDNNDDDDGNDYDSGNDDDGGNDAQDSEQTDSDDDENPSFILKDYEEEEQDEENVLTPEKEKSDDEDKIYEEEDDDVAKELYKDLKITLGLKDVNMTNVEQGRTEGPLQCSSISSDFTSKLLNLDDPSQDINSLVNTSTVPPPAPPFDQRVFTLETKVSEFNQTSQFTESISSISGIVDNYLASKLKEEVNVVVRLQSNKLIEEAEAENQEFINQVDSTIKKIIKEQVKAQVSKIMPQIENYVTESLGAEVLILIDKMETNESINRSDIQRNLYNALVEAYNIDKDILSSYDEVVTLKRGRDDQDKDEDPSAGSDRGMKRRKSSTDNKSSGKSTQVEEPEFEATDTEMHQDQGNDSGHIDDQPNNKAAPMHDWFQKPDKPPTPDHQGRQVVPANYFINNDLEYLKGGNLSNKYATSTTRTKAANLKVMRWYDYGYLEEIVVRRDDNVLYKFKQGDFPRLNLRDIKDMLLLLVQKKLSNLDVDDFIRRFTISTVKIDLDNLFGLMYEEYYATSPPEVTDTSTAHTLDNNDTSSSSSIVVEKDEAPQIVSSSTVEQNTQVLNENADEVVQEDVTKFDGNVFYYPPQTHVLEEAKSSSTYQDPSIGREKNEKEVNDYLCC
nr:hypothetical protein [Tanacetum cinerariifolium]